MKLLGHIFLHGIMTDIDHCAPRQVALADEFRSHGLSPQRLRRNLLQPPDGGLRASASRDFRVGRTSRRTNLLHQSGQLLQSLRRQLTGRPIARLGYKICRRHRQPQQYAVTVYNKYVTKMLQIRGSCARRRREFTAEQRVCWIGNLYFPERDWVVERGIK
jgi:hypothetical protein